MSHETAPQLSIEDQIKINEGVKDTTKAAKEAWMAGADTYYYNHDTGTRHLGSTFANHSIRQGEYGRLDFTVQDRKDNSSREAHAYQTSSYEPGQEKQASILRVNRNGEVKDLRSENPAVYKMIAEMALKGVKNEAQAELESHKARRAA